MSGITSVLDIAARALTAEQLGVEVTSHNVANVDTPGYSRQQVLLQAADAVPSGWGPLGHGVQVGGIERTFNPFVTARLDEKTSVLQEYESKKSFLEQVAAVFNETQEGDLNGQLSSFFAALNDLADNPAGTAERQALLQQGLNLCDSFNTRSEQLSQIRQSLMQQVGPTLNEINTLTSHIAQLNLDIQEMEVNGTANDLRDQRDYEIYKLSKLIGVRYYTAGDGTVTVTLNNGTNLVQGVLSFDLDYQLDANDNLSIRWNGPNGTTEDITAYLSGGKLSALVEVRDHLINGYQQDFNRLAEEFIAGVNTQHTQGVGTALFDAATGVTGTYQVSGAAAPLNNAGLAFGDRLVNGAFSLQVDRNGAPLARGTITVDPTMSLSDLVNAINTNATLGPLITASIDNNRLKIVADQGTDTFGFAQDTSKVLMALGVNTFFTGENAYTFGVNASVLTTPAKIATGRFDPLTGAHAVGDNRNALALAGLESTPLVPIASQTLTLAEAYRDFTSEIGLDTQQAGQQVSFYQSIVEQLQAMRDSVSGVSLDEEMSNLIKYQRAYQAAARLVTVADEIYQALVGMLD